MDGRNALLIPAAAAPAATLTEDRLARIQEGTEDTRSEAARQKVALATLNQQQAEARQKIEGLTVAVKVAEQEKAMLRETAETLKTQAEAERIQELYLDGKQREAIAAVSDELIDDVSLVGSPERIRDRLDAWRESGATTLLVATRDVTSLRTMAELAL